MSSKTSLKLVWQGSWWRWAVYERGRCLIPGFRRNDEVISNFQAFLPPENPFSSPCQMCFIPMIFGTCGNCRPSTTARIRAIAVSNRNNYYIFEKDGEKASR